MNNVCLPLYQNIYNDIRDKIVSEELVPGDRLPTEAELAEQYDVSRITVSRAFQELVKEGYVTRYRSKGSFVSDQAATDSHLLPHSEQSNTLAFVMPFSSGTVPQMMFAMQHAAQNKNFIFSIFNSEKSLEKERDILIQLTKLPLAGIICYPIESYENLSYYSPFILRGTPLVSIDKTIPFSGIPCVKSHNFDGAYKMVQYLIEKGHTRIAFYTHTMKDENEKQRFLGYLNALIDNGISPNNSFFFEIEKDCDPQHMMHENNPEIHSKIAAQLKHMMSLDHRPTALFCAFDLIATYVQQQAAGLGISIPEDLSVVGFDNLPLCDHLQVPLTSMAQDFTSIGNKAVKLISQKIEGKEVESSYLFSGQVVERSSVKNLNKNNLD